MKAEISMSQLWANPSVRNFFFRAQAENTLQELIESVEEDIDVIFDTIEDMYDDVDDMEEFPYNEALEDIISELGLTPIEE